MRPQEGKDELVDVKDFLVAKAAETPSGTKVNPASPLKTDQGRPIPAGAALSQQPTTAGTLTPDPTSGEAAVDPAAPSSERAQPLALRRDPEPSVTKAPEAPELSTGEAGVAPTTVPAHGARRRASRTPPRRPPTNGMGSAPHLVRGGGSSEESAPRTTS